VFLSYVGYCYSISLFFSLFSFSFLTAVDISIASLAEQICLLDQQLNQKIHEELLLKKYAKPETCPVITKLACHWNAVRSS
jgi:hypothetical protein